MQAKCNSTFFRKNDLSLLCFHSNDQCASGLYYLMLTFVLGWWQLRYNIGDQYIKELGMAWLSQVCAELFEVVLFKGESVVVLWKFHIQ